MDTKGSEKGKRRDREARREFDLRSRYNLSANPIRDK